MTYDNSRVMQDGVSLLISEDDFLNFVETTDNLFKTLDTIRDVVQCRTNIFMQKKEKHQQILDSQMMKLDNERKDYIGKSEVIMMKMGEAKSQLMQIEHSYFSMRNKLNSEKQIHRALEEKIKQLQFDCKQKNAKFYKTSELFTTVISYYKEQLSIGVSLEKDNPKIFTVTFKERKKDLNGYPYIKLEKLDEDKFQTRRSKICRDQFKYAVFKESEPSFPLPNYKTCNIEILHLLHREKHSTTFLLWKYSLKIHKKRTRNERFRIQKDSIERVHKLFPLNVLKMHPSLEENNIMKQTIQSHEIVVFLNKFQHFLTSN